MFRVSPLQLPQETTSYNWDLIFHNLTFQWTNAKVEVGSGLWTRCVTKSFCNRVHEDLGNCRRHITLCMFGQFVWVREIAGIKMILVKTCLTCFRTKEWRLYYNISIETICSTLKPWVFPLRGFFELRFFLFALRSTCVESSQYFLLSTHHLHFG